MRRVLSSDSRSRRTARLSSRTDCAHVSGASVRVSGSASISRSTTERWTVRSSSWGAIVARGRRARRLERHRLYGIEAADLAVEVVFHVSVAAALVETAVEQAHRASHGIAGFPILQLVRFDLFEQLFENRQRNG